MLNEQTILRKNFRNILPKKNELILQTLIEFICQFNNVCNYNPNSSLHLSTIVPTSMEYQISWLPRCFQRNTAYTRLWSNR